MISKLSSTVVYFYVHSTIHWYYRLIFGRSPKKMPAPRREVTRTQHIGRVLPPENDASGPQGDRSLCQWNPVNFRPQNILHYMGLKILFAKFKPDYTARTMNAEVYDNPVLDMYTDIRPTMLAEIVEHRASCLAFRFSGHFLAGQYITFS